MDSNHFNPNELFFRIIKNKVQVFIDHSFISKDQTKQIMSEDIKIVVPNIKMRNLRPSAPSITCNNVNTAGTANLSKASDCRHSRLVLNYKNDSNDKNVVLNCRTTDIQNNPKRRLRSDFIKDKSRLNEKRAKCDFKPMGGTGLNICSVTQNKNKENNNCNTELSRVIGLPNMGNTCYINSIIQVLRMTPGFRQFVCSLNKSIANNKNGIKLKASNKQLIACLHNIFFHFGDNELKADKSADLSTNEFVITDLIECEDFKNRFEFGQQQDCHEFLNWLINELNSFAQLLFPNKKSSNNLTQNTYNTRRKNSNCMQSSTFQNFHGVMLRNIMCNECKHGSSTHDSFADIQIPLCLNEEMTDISKSQTFTEIIHKKDYLKDENKFDCLNCSKKTNAFVMNSIKIPPKVLIIFIKKPFEYNHITTRNTKPLKQLFKVPLNLEYCSSEHTINYSLYGFVMHNGSDIDNGHYYAVINSGPNQKGLNTNNECSCALNALANNGWIKINDNKVNKLSTSHLNRLINNNNFASTPYLAFYRID